MENQNSIRMYTKKEGKILINYFDKINFYNVKSVIIDIGRHGTMERAIEKISKTKCKRYSIFSLYFVILLEVLLQSLFDTDNIHNFSKAFYARKFDAAKYGPIIQLKESILSILISPLRILRNLKSSMWRQAYMRQQPRLLECVLRLNLRYHKVFSLAQKTIFEPHKVPRYLSRKLRVRH